jgi:predicted DNA-binding WGR domain protein
MNPVDTDSRLPSESPETPVRIRWEKHSRYYEAHVERDLWGDWVLTRVWGRRGTAMGKIRRMPCASYADALEKLQSLREQRERRGYSIEPVSPPG